MHGPITRHSTMFTPLNKNHSDYIKVKQCKVTNSIIRYDVPHRMQYPQYIGEKWYQHYIHRTNSRPQVQPRRQKTKKKATNVKKTWDEMLLKMHRRFQNTIQQTVNKGLVLNVRSNKVKMITDPAIREQYFWLPTRPKLTPEQKLLKKQEHDERIKRNRFYKSFPKSSRKENDYYVTRSIQTPPWAHTEDEQTQLATMNRWCEKISERIGVKHNLDHIIPLRGDFVSGLHCVANLQIMDKRKNGRKGNRFQIQ